RIVVDILDDQRAQRIIENQQHQHDAPGPAPDAPRAAGGSAARRPQPSLTDAVPRPAPPRGCRSVRRNVVLLEGHDSPYHSSRDETGARTARVHPACEWSLLGMALDPESQRLLDLMAAANRPAWNTLTPAAARELYLSLRPAAQGPRPADVTIVDR